MIDKLLLVVMTAFTITLSADVCAQSAYRDPTRPSVESNYEKRARLREEREAKAAAKLEREEREAEKAAKQEKTVRLEAEREAKKAEKKARADAIASTAPATAIPPINAASIIVDQPDESVAPTLNCDPTKSKPCGKSCIPLKKKCRIKK
jgi:ATPase subunit of ABC transporter with duplicated ATPase domains